MVCVRSEEPKGGESCQNIDNHILGPICLSTREVVRGSHSLYFSLFEGGYLSFNKYLIPSLLVVLVYSQWIMKTGTEKDF